MALIRTSGVAKSFELSLIDCIYGNIIGSGISGLESGKKYLLIVNNTGAGAFDNHIDANKSGFNIDERNTSHSPNLLYIITTTATTISSISSGIGTTTVNCWVVPIE